jgi:Cellulase (glycosyl hydrolase family 5)
MARISRTLTTVLAGLLLAAGAGGAAPALADHSQLNFFEASNELLVPSERAKTFQTLEHLGVKALRVELYWYDVAPDPNSATRPNFEGANPASYDWSLYDPILAEAQRLHWPVLLTVTSPVPRWATSNQRAPYITRPDDKDFQEFMTALALHYGSEVSIYSVWNEPNHPAFLLPQFNANGTPASPRIYRGLYQAAYAGLQAAGLTHPRILFGETAPTGYDHLNVRREGALHDVAPLEFLREALCLNRHYRKSPSCGELQMSGYAHHAYTTAVAPSYRTPGADNVTIGTLSRLEAALNLAARAHAIPAGLPIYLTEFGTQSLPNKQLGVPVAVQAEYNAIAEHIAWSDPRVVAFSQYLLKDDPLGGAPGASVHGGTVGFQTGLEYYSGKPKPLYYGWPVPLTVTRDGHRFALWGLVRPATGAARVTILVKAPHAKSYRTLKTVSTNGLGYWQFISATRGETWRVRWVTPAHVTYEGPPIHAH